MKFKRILFGIVLLLFTRVVFPQSDSLISNNLISSNLKISYNSSLIYPGARIGIEVPVYSINLTKYNNSPNPKQIKKERFVTSNAGWYHHPGFHDNFYLTAEWEMRRTNKSGFFTEFSIGPGYSRTFNGGTTYRVDNNGNANIIKSAGYSYALIISGGGFGFDFSKKEGAPFLVFYKYEMLTMFPYNSTLYFRPVMELGIIYKPARFICVSVKSRVVKK
jgi:hypothetical protein